MQYADKLANNIYRKDISFLNYFIKLKKKNIASKI